MVDTPANTVLDPAETSFFSQITRNCGRIDRLKQALVGTTGQYRIDVEVEMAERESTLELLRQITKQSKAAFATFRKQVCKAIAEHSLDKSWKVRLAEAIHADQGEV